MLHRLIAATSETRGVPMDQVMQEFKCVSPQGEFQEPEDVANAVLFLVSDEAKRITGLAMVVDGGCTLGSGENT